MTIAAGVLCAEGVVLASDSKEGYGETHTYVNKVTTARSDEYAAAVASSGEAYLLDYITPHIKSLLATSKGTSTELECDLRNLMVRMYDSDEVRNYPKDKASDLYTQFLVATQRIGEEFPALFIINSTLVTKTEELGTVIGCGPLTEVGAELGLAAGFSIEKAKAAAMCIVYEAKRRYSDVGGQTSLVAILNNGKMVIEPSAVQVEKELLVDSIRRLLNSLTVSTLDSALKPKQFNGLMQRICSELRAIHRKSREIEIRHKTEYRKKITKLIKKAGQRKVKRLASRKLALEP